MNPEHFQARQEKLLSPALSLEQPSIRKQSPSAKQSVPETISPGEGVRDYSRGASPPAPETAAFHTSGSQPVVKWSPKDLSIGVSTVQVTGTPKGTSVVKDTAPPQVRPREPMSVLMMASREVASTELGSYRDGADSEDCSQPMDDIQVSTGQGSPAAGPSRLRHLLRPFRRPLRRRVPPGRASSPPRSVRCWRVLSAWPTVSSRQSGCDWVLSARTQVPAELPSCPRLLQTLREVTCHLLTSTASLSLSLVLVTVQPRP